MTSLNYQVNKDELEEVVEPVPAGDYIVVIIDSEYKENKSGTGNLLSLKYQIVDGHFKGRILFNNLNLEHVNKQAQEIARRSLNSIGVATGIEEIQDSAQLHNIPMMVSVSVKDSPDFGKQNSIKKHFPVPANTIAKDNDFNTSISIQNQNSLNGKQKQPQKQPWEK